MQVAPREILANHRYQFDGSHRNRNECALSAMTTLLETAAQRNGVDLRLEAAALGRYLDRVPLRYPRVPAWFPGPGGATHPRAAWKGMQDYIADLKQQDIELHWRVMKRHRCSLADLQTFLRYGEMVMLYGVGRSGVPHTVIPLERNEDGWSIQDPGYPAAKNPRQWSEEEMQAWWTGYGWFYPEGTLVALIPVAVP